MRSLLLSLLATLAVPALAQEPVDGAEARLLLCGPWPTLDVSVFRWGTLDGQPVLTQLKGQLVQAQSKAERTRTGKPPAGCFKGFPPPSAEWNLKLVETWKRDAQGRWTDSRGRDATLTCTAMTVDAVENPTELVLKPNKGCGDADQLVLKGGPRAPVNVTRCKMSWAGQALTLTFGVERIASEWDCTSGGDWRRTP